MEQNPSGEKVKVITTNDEYTFNGVIQVPSKKITMGVVYENGKPETDPDDESVFHLEYDVPENITIAVTEFETESDGTAVTCIAETDNKERCTITAQEGEHVCHIHNKSDKNDTNENNTESTHGSESERKKDAQYVINYTGSFEAKRVIGIISEGTASFHMDEFEYHAYGRITNEFLNMVKQRYDPKGEPASDSSFY